MRTISNPITTPRRRIAPADEPTQRLNYFGSRHVSSRFGIRLRHLRKERELTQLSMAVNFGMDRTFISDIERGRKSVSLQTLHILSLGLKVSLSELVRDL